MLKTLRQRHLKRIYSALLFAILSLFLGSTFALPNDSQQPIKISANTLKIDQKKKVSIYLGDVLYTQGSIRLTADKAVVKTLPDRSLKQITALGDKATFNQQVDETTKVIAKANKIKFNAKTNVIELIDDAYIKNNKDTFSAEYITYDLEKKLITSQGGRTEITIHPNKTKGNGESS